MKLKICSTAFKKNPQKSNFIKIYPILALLSERTDATKLIFASRNFMNGPKMTI